jgi:polysaccharide export outer membrane protein
MKTTRAEKLDFGLRAGEVSIHRKTLNEIKKAIELLTFGIRKSQFIHRSRVSMRNLIRLFFLCILAYFFSSCSNKQYQNLFQQKGAGTDTATINFASSIQNHYRIKPQDILEIRNLQNDKDIVDLNPSVTGSPVTQVSATQVHSGHLVEDDGTIALTGLGRIQVAGLTRVEAEKMIEGLYHKALLKDPIIEVKVANLTVTLFGEVKATGNLPLIKDRTTLVQMLGAAGGLTENANEKDIKIIRGDHNNPQVIRVDLSNIKSINDPRTILQSGDIVYVEKNRRAVRNEKFGNLTQIVQPLLLLFSVAAVVYTFAHR